LRNPDSEMRRGFSLCGIGNVIDKVLQEVP